MAAIEMKAGKMKLIGTRLTPDKRKGTLRLFNSPEDTLLHLTWTSRETGVMEDDRIIFPGDAEFKYVEQARNNPKNPRVYVLKFQGSTERLFFWMQNPSADKDEENMKRINARISGEDDGAAGGLGGMDQQQLLEMLTRAAGNGADADSSDTLSPAAAPAEDAQMDVESLIPTNTAQNLANVESAGGGAGAAGGTRGVSQASLQQILANLGGGAGGGQGNRQSMHAMAAAQANREGPSLSDVLEGRQVQQALSHIPELQQELLEQLPEGDRSVAALNEVLRSPQLSQAVGQLDHVLQSGQGRELLLSFGLQPAQGFDMYGPPAVGNMLDQIQKKEDKDKK
eukprot:Tamp_20902.p1 GENE.Tamp_20902~~Tamp_20902.p1  ORF type:complete len:340 (+),score=103.74 Tamp_20902:2-1021(+)